MKRITLAVLLTLTLTTGLVAEEPKELAAKIRETAALFLAAGIDPEQSSVIVQSSVAEHAELAWMLTCVTPLGCYSGIIIAVR